MSNETKLTLRLRELSHAVTQGREAVASEFTMRVPAEPKRDADLVLSTAADVIDDLYAALEELTEWARDIAGDHDEQDQRDKEDAMMKRMDAALARARGETNQQEQL